MGEVDRVTRTCDHCGKLLPMEEGGYCMVFPAGEEMLFLCAECEQTRRVSLGLPATPDIDYLNAPLPLHCVRCYGAYRHGDSPLCVQCLLEDQNESPPAN